MRFPSAHRLGRTKLVLALLATTAASAAPAPREPAPPRRAAGSIEGIVVISSSLTARRPVFRPYADPGSGAVPPAATRDSAAAEARNVVIYLEADTSLLSPSQAQLDAHRRGSVAQRDERFTPHVLAVVQGATVDFPNDDDVYHNVYSLSSAAGPNGFDLGRYPKGASRSRTFPKAGKVQVFCHIHTDMSAILHVLPNPFFASPDESHRFVIDDVPEGEYTIVAWHERITPPITRRIRVTAGQAKVENFNIPLPQGGGGRP